MDTHEPEKRTPDRIADEIIALRGQNKKILLMNAVEIGRCLAEAREIIPQGNFAKWLAEAVHYEVRTANNFIRVYEQYGSKLAFSSDNSPEASPFASLGYCQALVLLGLPEEERADFIAGLDLENISVRELKRAVEERNQARLESIALSEQLKSYKNAINNMHSRLQRANAENERITKTRWREQGSLNKLKQEIRALKEETHYGWRMAELEEKCNTAVTNMKIARAKALFDLIVKGFHELLDVIEQMIPADPEPFAFHTLQLSRFISKVEQRLKKLETRAALATLEAAKAAAAEKALEIMAAEEAAEAKAAEAEAAGEAKAAGAAEAAEALETVETAGAVGVAEAVGAVEAAEAAGTAEAVGAVEAAEAAGAAQAPGEEAGEVAGEGEGQKSME